MTNILLVKGAFKSGYGCVQGWLKARYRCVKGALYKSFAGLGLAMFVDVAWRIVIKLQEKNRGVLEGVLRREECLCLL